MYIELSDEQRMLKDSAEKYLRENYLFEKRQKIVKSSSPYSQEQWTTFAELGWLAMIFDEADGGFGGGTLETMLLSEQLGYNLVVEPYLETVVLGGQLIAMCGNETLKAQYLEPLLAGQCQLALAWTESQHAHSLSDVAMTAEIEGDIVVLNGHKTLVLNGAAADSVIVVVRTGSVPGSMEGLSLVLVPMGADGVSRSGYKTHDGRNAAQISFDHVKVATSNMLGQPDKADALLRPVWQQATLSLCAEGVGAMSALLEATIDYTKQRQQFGRPISSFQVLRHRMADMFMEIELTRSLMMAAAYKLDRADEDASACLSALKAKVAKAGKFVAHNAIQLHGGIGTTDELNVGHFFKRIAAINILFGTRDYHLSEFADSIQKNYTKGDRYGS